MSAHDADAADARTALEALLPAWEYLSAAYRPDGDASTRASVLAGLSALHAAECAIWSRHNPQVAFRLELTALVLQRAVRAITDVHGNSSYPAIGGGELAAALAPLGDGLAGHTDIARAWFDAAEIIARDEMIGDAGAEALRVLGRRHERAGATR